MHQIHPMLLEKYTPQWERDFTSIQLMLAEALRGIDCHLEHVGSTSVPGLAAKPIIDIDIVYFQQVDFEHIKARLERLGYYHNGNQGIEDREVFKRSGSATVERLDSITHHLYVCPVGSKALERHLLMRDYLRAHERARHHYQQLKNDLAEKAGQDRKKYAALKELHVNVFIDSIVEKQRSLLQQE